MIKLKALSDQAWQEHLVGTVEGVREAWAASKGSFGIISDGEEPDPVPKGWQSRPGFLLATPRFVEVHAPDLMVESRGDGSLPVVVDPSFPAARIRDVAVGGRPGHERGQDFPLRPEPHTKPLIPVDYPDWFLSRPISELRLPPGLGGFLAPMGTVAGLVPLDCGHVMAAPNLGYGAVLKLRARTQAAYKRLLAKALPVTAYPVARPDGATARHVRRPPVAGTPKPAPRDSGYSLDQPFGEHVAALAADLPDGDRDILLPKLGLAGGPMRFEELAGMHGMSREKVRRLYLEATGVLDARTGCFTVLKAWLSAPGRSRPADRTSILAETWTAGLPVAAVEFLMWDLAGLRFAKPPVRRGGGGMEAAVIEALGGARDGISERDVARTVSSNVGRRPSVGSVRALVRRHGRSGDDGLWTLAPPGAGSTDHPGG